MNTVAALFVSTKGPYFQLADVDAWDEIRDARKYDGSLPVVAHPPCQLWINFAYLNYRRWGGEHNRPGNDGGCFESALRSVRRCGGVLEHPAFSRAFEKFGLSRPDGVGWTRISETEWVCEVWQSAYGHLAQKRTWLFYCGKVEPKQLNWDRPEGTHQIGGFDKRKPVLSGIAASLTPLLFAEELIDLARFGGLL